MKSLSVLMILLISLIIVSCSDTTSPSSNPTTGSVVGNVMIYSGSGSQYERYFDSVEIRLEDTPYATITDGAGHWSMKVVSTGVYNILYSKRGFGVTRSYGIAVHGNGTDIVPAVVLERAPVDSVSILGLDTSSVSKGRINVNYHAANGVGRVGFCVDRTADAAPQDVHAFASLFGTLNLDEMSRMGLRSGVTYFVSAFAIPYHYGSYDDPINGGFRFGSCGPKSNVVSFVMP